MSRNLRLGVISIIVGNLLFYFVNCAGGLPDNLNGTTSASQTTSVKNLTFLMNPPQIVPSTGTATASVSGGTQPYTFRITSGTAFLDSAGNLSQPSLGTVTVEVTDAKGLTAFASVNVANPVTTPGGGTPPSASCTTPWGVTIASGQTIVGFATATVDCPSTAACTPLTMTCTNGVLSGANLATVSPSCSYRACVYKQTSSTTGCVDGSGGHITMLPGTTIPASCDVSMYRQFACIGINNGYGYATELQCVGPTESAQ